MRTQWTTKGNRDAGSSCLCDRGLHRYVQNFWGRGGWTPQTPPWYATGLVHTWLWILCRSILGLSTHAITCRSSRSRPHCLCWPYTLHGPITQKPTISNLNNIIQFACIVSLCYIKLCPHVRQYIALLFYIILRSEQKCIAGNIMKNSKICCLISVYSCHHHHKHQGLGHLARSVSRVIAAVCSCFVIILKFYIS